MNQNTKICSCNGIKKRDIIRAINKSHVFKFEKYMELSFIGSSCGRCIPTAQKIFEEELEALGDNIPYTLDL